MPITLFLRLPRSLYTSSHDVFSNISVSPQINTTVAHNSALQRRHSCSSSFCRQCLRIDDWYSFPKISKANYQKNDKVLLSYLFFSFPGQLDQILALRLENCIPIQESFSKPRYIEYGFLKDYLDRFSCSR
jgi:hypothetical protein